MVRKITAVASSFYYVHKKFRLETTQSLVSGSYFRYNNKVRSSVPFSKDTFLQIAGLIIRLSSLDSHQYKIFGIGVTLRVRSGKWRMDQADNSTLCILQRRSLSVRQGKKLVQTAPEMQCRKTAEWSLGI